MSTISEQLNQLIMEVIEPLVSNGIEIINSKSVAVMVFNHIQKDRDKINPIIQHVSIQSLSNSCRNILNRKYRSLKKSENDFQECMEGFEGVLQDYYPVIRETEHVYCNREELTDFDVDEITSIFRKRSDSYGQHADALDAWNLLRKSTPIEIDG